MNDKKYYTDDERRRYGLDLRKITYEQKVYLKHKIFRNYDFVREDYYNYFAYSEITGTYYQTTNYKDEGLTIVNYDEFLRINNLKP